MRRVTLLNLFFAYLIVAGLAGYAWADVPSGTVSTKDLEDTFKPRTRGFLGADGAASVDLGDGRTLWVFGDTILGDIRGGSREGSMVHNSIAIMSAQGGAIKSNQFYWDLTDNLPGAFFHPESFSDPQWYWPGTGFRRDGKVYLVLSRMAKGEGPDAFAFQTVGCTLFRIDNPGAEPNHWKMTRTEMGYGNDHFNLNSASLVEGEYLYLMGYDDGPDKAPMKRRAILSRLPLARLDDPSAGKALEFWSQGASWSPSAANLEPLFQPGPTETAILYDKPRSRYVALTMVPFKPDILMTTAPALTGPWSAPKSVYTIPELAGNEADHAYATRLHPMLSSENEAVYTYVVNTKDFWGMFKRLDIYHPRFATLPLDKLP